MRATPRTVAIPLVPVSDADGAELVLYGAVRDLAITVRPDDEHRPARGERRRWVLIIDAPDAPAERM